MSPRRDEQVELGGDEHQLFRELQPQVLRLLRATLVTREQTLEDACGFAWMQFVVHQPARGYARAWLYVVARHEALRLIARDARMIFTGDAHASLAVEMADTLPSGDEPDARHRRAIEALEALAALPDRQRRLLSLKVAGFSYRELVAYDRSSYSAVNRHLARARAGIRAREGKE